MSMNTTMNPHFATWSKAFIKYCDGSSFTSNREAPVVFNGLMYWHRGRPNFDAVVAELISHYRLDTATEVILAGGSAGGLAALLALDHFAQRMGTSVRVTGLPDAGFFLDAPNVSWQYDFRSKFQEADASMWNSTLSGGTNLACLKAQRHADAWKCLMAQYVVPHIKTPYFLMNSAVDFWQIQNIMGLQCMVAQCSSEEFSLVEHYREAMLAALAPVTASVANGLYIDSCFMHEQDVYYCNGHLPNESGVGLHSGNCQGWLGEKVEGVSPQQAFLHYYTSNGKGWAPSNFIIDLSPWRLSSACASPLVAPGNGTGVHDLDLFPRNAEQHPPLHELSLLPHKVDWHPRLHKVDWHPRLLALMIGVALGFAVGGIARAARARDKSNSDEIDVESSTSAMLKKH